MRVEVREAGYNPTRNRSKPVHSGGSFLHDNKWLVLGVVAFVILTGFKFGWFTKDTPAAPAAPQVAAAAPAAPATPQADIVPPGWCKGPLAGYEQVIKPGRFYEPALYVLDIEQAIKARCENGQWSIIEVGEEVKP